MRLLAATVLLALWGMAGISSRADARQVKMLVLYSTEWVTHGIDPAYKQKLTEQGYSVKEATYWDVTPEALRGFNVVIANHEPTVGCGNLSDQEIRSRWSKIAPMLLDYVRGGGGLFIIPDESYYRVGPMLNPTMEPIGAQVLMEWVKDKDHLYQQPGYLRYAFAHTSQIVRHPVTDGIDSIWYPVVSMDYGTGCLTMKLDSNWTTLISGEPSAYSERKKDEYMDAARSYESAPPILAVREFGRGRIAITGMQSTFTVHAGYHRIWEGIVMESGAQGVKSDTARLLTKLYDWLSAPSIADPSLANEAADVKAAPKVDANDMWRVVQKPRPPKEYRGLIGAHTIISDGRQTVAESAQAARSKGYDFLVFTESLPLMDEPRWETLKAECKAASNGPFLAVPGVEYQDTAGNHYICYDMPRWLDKSWLSSDGSRVQSTPGIYFGENWAPLSPVAPHANPIGPWGLKFFGQFPLFTYDGSAPAGIEPSGPAKLIDDSVGLYMDRMRNAYNSVPVVIHRMYTPEQIPSAGYVTVVRAESLARVPESLKHSWYADPQSTYVSSGPKLVTWKIDGGWHNFDPQTISRNHWVMDAKVTSDSPLRTVTIYDGFGIFRRYYPNGTTFRTRPEGTQDRQRFFVLVAEDAEGRKAISPSLFTGSAKHTIRMCTDMQNTIEGGYQKDRQGRWQHINMMGNYVTCWDGLKTGILVPTDDMMPEGLDYVIGGFDGGSGHAIYTTTGNETPVASRRIVLGSEDVTAMDNVFNVTFGPNGIVCPTRIAETVSRYTSFTPRIYSESIILIEARTKMLRDVRMSERTGPELISFRISGPETCFTSYSYIAPDGRKVTGRREGAVAVPLARVRKGGYVSMYPDFYGNVAVYPLDQDMDFSIEGCGINIGRKLSGAHIAKGTEFTSRFLLVRGRFGDTDDSAFDRIRSEFGLIGKPACSVDVKEGRLLSAGFVTRVAASKTHGALVRTSQAELPCDLPVTVAGLNDNWDAAYCDLDSGSMRAIGIKDGTSYATVDTSRPRSVFIGHPVTASDKRVVIGISEFARRCIRFEVHNPSPKPVHVTLSGNPSLPLTSGWSQTIDLPAGGSRAFTIPGK